MKFKLVEDCNRLEEKFSVTHEAILEAQRQLKNLLHIGTTRGNGVLCEFIISAYNKIYGTTLNSNDYLIHHKDLNHNNNSWDNILLMNTHYTLKHIGFHNDITAKVIMQMVYQNNMHPTVPIDEILVNSLITSNPSLFINQCIHIGDLKADRVNLASRSTNIIDAEDVIR